MHPATGDEVARCAQGSVVPRLRAAKKVGHTVIMAVKRTSGDTSNKVSGLGIVELYLDDVDSLLATARSRSGSADLFAGTAQLDNAEDLRSVLPDELAHVRIQTQDPWSTLYLERDSCAVVMGFMGDADQMILLKSDLIAAVQNHAASKWVRTGIRLRGRRPWLTLGFSLFSSVATVIAVLVTAPGLPAMAAVFGVLAFAANLSAAWFGNVDYSAAVIVPETRANARRRFAAAKVSLNGSIIAGTVVAIVSAGVGYLAGLLLG